jgi:hypothetical protein
MKKILRDSNKKALPIAICRPPSGRLFLFMRRKKKRLQKWRQNSCEGKIDFKSFETAERAAERMNLKKERDNYHKLEAYQCSFCGGWHIGRKYRPS